MPPTCIESMAEVLEALIWSQTDADLAYHNGRARLHLSQCGFSVPALFAECSDECLILAVQKCFYRDEAFEEAIVRRYQEPLKCWYRRWHRDWQASEDYVQGLYLLLHRRALRGYRPDRPFSPWLWGVACKFGMSQLRRRRAYDPLPASEQMSLEALPEEEAEACELEARVDRVQAQLGEPHRSVLARAREGKSADQIALELSLTRQRVYRYLFQARRCVAQQLGLAGPIDDPRSE